ncbi:MAG: molybdenum cofactor biosynthesis protein MoaE [Gemmatimonadota bacterium]
MTFLTSDSIEVEQLVARVTNPDRGGITTFVGLVRNHQDGRAVTRLEYHAYAAMAESECTALVTEAQRRWPVNVELQHRIGCLAIGDVAIAVAVAGDHRDECFEGCRWVVEQVKHRVPIWKREYYADGSDAWVDPTRLATALTPDPLGSVRHG